MRKQQVLARFIQASGGFSALDAYWGKTRLTVLAYHRILDVDDSFEEFEPNVSASPALFEEEINFVRQHFNVIDLQTLHRHLLDGEALPPRPLLITFDDGYLDNYRNAYPILKAHGLPAVIFVVTGRMDNPTPLWWDECASIFYHTAHTQADLPLIGQQFFPDLASQRAVRDAFIERAKSLSDEDKAQTLQQLRSTLGSPPTSSAPLFVNWEQIREMASNGVICQPHTVNHPILTRISLEQARAELAGSRDMLARHAGIETIALAYPNGQLTDYNPAIMQILQSLGYHMAFTLTAGPMSITDVAKHPFEIKRVFLSYRDTIEIFKAKVMGVPALLSRGHYLGETN